MNDLERDSFELLMKQIKYDRKALEVRKARGMCSLCARCPSVPPGQAELKAFEDEMHRHEVSWNVHVHDECRRAAETFMATHVRVQVGSCSSPACPGLLEPCVGLLAGCGQQ